MANQAIILIAKNLRTETKGLSGFFFCINETWNLNGMGKILPLVGNTAEVGLGCGGGIPLLL